MVTIVKTQTPENLDIALADLVESTVAYAELAARIQVLQENGHFKYVSKTARNELLKALVEQAGEIEDASKSAFKLLKKVKRVKPTEDAIDALIGAPKVVAAVAVQESQPDA